MIVTDGGSDDANIEIQEPDVEVDGEDEEGGDQGGDTDEEEGN